MFCLGKTTLALAVAAATLPVTSNIAFGQRALEEIVVTAQRREETVQDTPISINVVSSDSLVREGVRQMGDLEKMSTEVDINFAAGQGNVIGMRGMQPTGFAPTTEGLVAVHLDGAYMPSVYSLNALMFDIDRIEMLSGPQGTLYGRNTAAGSVNLISAKPSQEFEGNAMLELGEYDLMRTAGAVNVPLSRDFSVRLAGQTLTQDAFFTDGSGDRKEGAVRISGLWTLTDQDQLYFTYDDSSYGGNGQNTGCWAIESTAPNPVTCDPYDSDAYYSNLPTPVPNQGKVEGSQWGGMLEYTHNFETFDLIAQWARRDLNGITRNRSGGYLTGWTKSDTVELRATSTANPNLEWVAGFFAVDAENLGHNATPMTPTGWNDAYDPCPCVFGFYPNNGTVESYALFGQATWTPESQPNLHLTAGARWTEDKKTADLGYQTGGTSIFNNHYEDSWEQPSWRLGAQYDFSPTSMAYASIATGYKSGGFAYGPTPSYEAEQLLAYEIGTKNQLLDNTLQLNASAWWYDHTDIESGVFYYFDTPVFNPNTGTFVTGAPTVATAGKVNFFGTSVDANWLATDNDTLGFGFTYVWSEIKEGGTAPNGSDIFVIGESFGNNPEWNVLARYNHFWTLFNGATLDAGLKYQWTSERAEYSDPSFYVQETVPARGVADFSLRYTTADQNWDFTAYVNNLTDELTPQSIAYDESATNATFGHSTAALGAPRTIGFIIQTYF